MHEIFISYSSKHRDLTRQLAEAIEAHYGAGSVWWDLELESRGSCQEESGAALDASRVAIVLWTKGDLISDWVYAEASRAMEQNKLINVRPADTSYEEIPEPFSFHPVGEADDIEDILATVAKFWNGLAIPTLAPLDDLYFRQHGMPLLDGKQEKLNTDWREILPSELLQAKYAAVPFQDSTGAKAECLAWCLDAGQQLAGRLYYGPGGLGKTRLLIEVAAELRQRGWTAGFLNRDYCGEEERRKEAWRALEQRVLNGQDEGLLIVVDTAEARQPELSEIAQLFLRRRENPGRHLRLILLARSAGWWERLRQEHDALAHVFRRSPERPDALALSPISSVAGRQTLFVESVKKFWPVLQSQGFPKPKGLPSRDLLFRITKGDGFERPLAIQIEALLWLCATSTASNGIAMQLDAVLGLERAHWMKLAGPLDDNAWRGMERGAAQVTAVAGTDTDAATDALLMADVFYEDRRTSRVAPALRNLTRVYGRAAGGAAPIEPGLLGEHHVASITDDKLIEGCLGWIETLSEADREKRRRDFIATLQRASGADHGEEVSARAAARLDYLILRHMPALAGDLVTMMAETPGQLQSRIEAALDNLDFEALRALDLALPVMHLQLLEFANFVSSRHAERAKAILEKSEAYAADADWQEFARNRAADALNLRAIRLSKLGKREEAVAAGQEAVDLCRRLAEARPDAFLQNLQTSLTNLGSYLFDLGRREEALAANQEAADIGRRLAEARPDAFLPDLADSLNHLGDDLFKSGRHEDALAACQEAVDIQRRLAISRPYAFLPDLARSLNNLGAMLSHLGRREEALAACQEAVDAQTRLAGTRRDAFLPGLAASLSSLSVRLSDLSRFDEALAASRKAVDIERRLAESRPGAFLPSLAGSLNNLGVDLFNLGLWEEALAVTKEAVDIRRRLAESRPDAFLPGLAMSLINLGVFFSELGLSEEALEAGREAVALHRRLTETQAGAFQPGLATSLRNLGKHLSGLGRPEEAVAAGQEAVDLCRQLAEDRPDAFLQTLQTSLINLGSYLFDAGRREEAVVAGQEAADIGRRLAEARPDAFLPDLADSLNNLGNMLCGLGRQEEALAASREAVDIQRRLAESRPDAFQPGLAMSLNNLGERLSGLERWEEAVAASHEAVAIYRRLAEARPDVFMPDLANSLGTLGLASTGRAQHLEAAGALKEALEIVAPFVDKLPQAVSQLSTKLLKAYAPACKAAGVEADACLLERLERTAPVSQQTQSETLGS